MKPGSVIVDMATANGGKVAGTVAGEKVVPDNGVTILGYTDLAERLPAQASQLYSTNLVNLAKLLTPGKDGTLVLDLDDVVQRAMTVVREGASMWPPPPVQVSAAPAAKPQAQVPAPVAREKPPTSSARRYGSVAAAAVVLFLIGAVSPPVWLSRQGALELRAAGAGLSCGGCGRAMERHPGTQDSGHRQ